MKKKVILVTSLAVMLATAGTTLAAGHSSEMGRMGNSQGNLIRQEQQLQDENCDTSEYQYQYQYGGENGGNGSGSYGENTSDGICDGTGVGNGSGNGICDGSCLE